jgi:hypothetical protein
MIDLTESGKAKMASLDKSAPQASAKAGSAPFWRDPAYQTGQARKTVPSAITLLGTTYLPDPEALSRFGITASEDPIAL